MFRQTLTTRVATYVAALLLFTHFAYSQSAGHDRSLPKNARTYSDSIVMSNAIDRFKRELGQAPKKLRGCILGNWTVIQFTLRKTKSVATPLSAAVILNYSPLSILKYNPSYRYRLRLELRHNAWYLVTAEEQPYFKDRPPSLETFDHRSPRPIPPTSSEFNTLESCFSSGPQPSDPTRALHVALRAIK